MRQTILALTAALAVLPALAFASAPPDTLPESYPAAMWQAVDSATQALLRDSDRWPLAAAHPELERLLPHVSFYLRRWTPMPHATAPALNDAFAVLNGKKYGLQSLNSLLVDAGFKYDTSEVPAVAKIAVLWTLMRRQAVLHRSGRRPGGAPPPDSAALATAIPAVTFRKIGWG